MKTFKEAIEMKERRIKDQKEECERVKQRILKSLEEEMSSSELSKASIIYKREEDSLLELEAELKIMQAILKRGE
jgi:hypothetical protein